MKSLTGTPEGAPKGAADLAASHPIAYKLSPSILAADFSRLGEQIQAVDRGGAHYIHMDVMDGIFVPNISFGVPVIRSVRPLTDKVFDVHLMVKEPHRYIQAFADCGADSITVHAEACDHGAADDRKSGIWRTEVFRKQRPQDPKAAFHD